MSLDYILVILLSLTLLVTMIAILILVERKLLALSQRRVGPVILGRRGFLQVIADVIKPLFKEVFEHKFQTVTLVFFMIFLLLATQIMYLAFFSFGVNGTLYDTLEMVVVLQIVLSGVSCLSIFLIGYLSRSKYGMLGAIRMVFAEMSIEAVVMLLNSLILLNTSGFDFNSMCSNQNTTSNIWILSGIFSFVYIIHLFLIAQRAPLDLIENEGELVAGYNTEYSGPDVLVIYFAEYLHIVNGVLQTIWLLIGYSILTTNSFFLYDGLYGYINFDSVINYIDVLYDFITRDLIYAMPFKIVYLDISNYI